MADYELSVKADQDFTGIYRYSFEAFGETKADDYLLGLEDCLNQLADKPLMGRLADDIEDGLYRYPYARHIVFYVVKSPGIFVARILHRSMDHPQHLGSA